MCYAVCGFATPYSNDAITAYCLELIFISAREGSNGPYCWAW